MTTSIMWFRRDLRLADNPALIQAVEAADEVVPVFVLDPALWRPAGAPRRAYLLASLHSLRDSIGGLVVRSGDPADELALLAADTGAASVHAAADFGPYGRRRDAEVEQRLSELRVPLVQTGSPYAVAPGTLHTAADQPFSVFSPFSKAWQAHGWPEPAALPDTVSWSLRAESSPLPQPEIPAGVAIPPAGEAAAVRRWRTFLEQRLDSYGNARNRPDLEATSRMSVHLKWGEIHVRTLLADLASSRANATSVQRYRTELAWRDFYADVLLRRPDSAREYYRPEFADLAYQEPGGQFDAWCEGRTGYPIVDAGMRQLLAEGWMHNRVRMIVASFLVKDLHIDWRHGARHFMRHLVDADLASNMHGWQWTAGSGTDPAPYYRVFNPIVQGEKFDPDGVYIRRYVRELRDVAAPEIHQPRNPIVDHAVERQRALADYETVRERRTS
jgi:deoxyribodipyrimidine photo-lyase